MVLYQCIPPQSRHTLLYRYQTKTPYGAYTESYHTKPTPHTMHTDTILVWYQNRDQYYDGEFSLFSSRMYMHACP